MSKTILTYQISIELVSHSSYTSPKFLILVIRVTSVSFAIESFATYEKVLVMMLHMKIISLLLTF